MNGKTAPTRTAGNQTWRRSEAHFLNSGLPGSPKFTRAASQAGSRLIGPGRPLRFPYLHFSIGGHGGCGRTRWGARRANDAGGRRASACRRRLRSGAETDSRLYEPGQAIRILGDVRGSAADSAVTIRILDGDNGLHHAPPDCADSRRNVNRNRRRGPRRADSGPASCGWFRVQMKMDLNCHHYLLHLT